MSCHHSILKVVDPKPYHSSPVVSASLIFQNSHYVTETSGRPVPPNLIDVGGIHLKPPKGIPKVSSMRSPLEEYYILSHISF